MERKEIAVKCWFTIAGIPMPLMFKVMADDDVVTIDKLKVIDTIREREFGNITWKFKVQAVVNNSLKEFKMEFDTKFCKWYIL